MYCVRILHLQLTRFFAKKAQNDRQGTGNREQGAGKRMRLGFDILNEVKNLTPPTNQILRNSGSE